MQKMKNGIQHYAWGSHSALTELYGIANPDNKPMAEMWMGAHPLCSSQITINGKSQSLREVIAHNPEALLGSKVNARFGELPFLFKVLCAAQPLSIQVHPSKAAAEIGFAKENIAGIPLTAAERNYKDPNHKPELVFAITVYDALNGFREFAEIASLLKPVADAHPAIANFIQRPDAEHLSRLFATLLSLNGAEKTHALGVLKSALAQQQGEPWQTISHIMAEYPDDNGLFSPLMLNVVRLQPGEAMFLYSETPHAYLQGTGLEVMANSDNVLRAGLTPKYIDIPELLANVRFEPKPANSLLMQPQQTDGMTVYPIPVDDFAFALHPLSDKPQTLDQSSAAVVFCVKGHATLQKGQQIVQLAAGESCFISAEESPVLATGDGQLARVYNQLA